MRSIKYVLLPILGIVAAVLAFRFAAPYEDTLNRPWLGEEDARALFTYGTKWGEVNRIAFGALICGPFAVVLALGRRSVLHVILAGFIGAVLGGMVNFVTDSGADLIGLAVSAKRAGTGPIMAMVAWCLLVPLGIAFTLVVAQGVTKERIHRATVAFKYAAFASFAVQLIGGMLASQDGNGEVNLVSQIPVWRMVEIAVGLSFGVTILLADEYVRKGTIRLLHGRNEYVDWSLDHAVSRVGSAEACEIYVRGYKGVEPVHAIIARQGDRFVIDARGPTLVNDQPVTQALLNSQDQIRIGDALLVFTSAGWTPNLLAPTFAPTPVPVPVTIPAQPLYIGGQPQPKILQDAYGHQIPLPPGRYLVGREMTNAICLQHDVQVSPTHAELLVSDAGITLSDLGSSTGTRLNGVTISAPSALRPGDVMEFGSSKFTFVR